MAVNKNFVVKHGLEVNSDLILADSTNKRVGIGSTIPDYTLDVIGGIGATDIYISGLSTFVGFSTFQDSIGVQKDITIAGISTVVGVATFKSDVYVDGNLNVTGDITYDEVSGRNIYISGLSTFVGVSTFESTLFAKDVVVSGVSSILGFTTISNNVYIAGYSTVTQDLTVGGNLNVTGDISYDQVTGREIYISGLSTFVGLSSFVNGVYIGGITTTAGSGGITTTGGNLSVGTDLLVAGVSTFVGVSTHQGTLFAKDLYVTGVSTFGGALAGEDALYISSNVGVGTTNAAIAADPNNTKILNVGIVTANYIYGDISAASGSASIGLSSEGTFVGAGVSLINLASTNGTAWTISTPSSGVATATVTPGVSLGLAIALGG